MGGIGVSSPGQADHSGDGVQKASVVAADEREGGARATLNYGHTLAHALETTGRYDLRHGEAVAIGLIYAAELAHRMGRISSERVAEHRKVVAALLLD